VITLDLASPNWTVSSGGLSQNGNVVFAPTTNWSTVEYTYTGPLNLVGATLTYLVNFDSSFKASGASVQVYAQYLVDPWPGQWKCWFDNSAIVAGTDQTITCNEFSIAALNVTTTDQVKFGLQVSTSPTGTLTIKSATITPAP
jgi:hypothetical protein